MAFRYGDGMNRSYVQNQSFENNLFQYVFARWDYRTAQRSIIVRHEKRFAAEIRNILFELQEKKQFISELADKKTLFKIKRLAVWLVTLLIFGGAVTAIYFANQYTFQVRVQTVDRTKVTNSPLL